MPGRILLIEDEPSIADNVAYALKTEGMEPVCCGTGEEGLAALAAGCVDLVILDVGLPDTSGFDLCRTIRKTSAVPVIFLTARADEIDRVVGLEIGADDYVVKPFSPRELTARVKAVLRRAAATPATGAPTPLAHGPFVVDRARCRVTYHDASLDLSRTEYRLLAVFVERPGWVFSREQLMERAWDAPEASLDRTVDAHVKSLRRKLRAVRPGEDPIVTHRGLGYALREEP